MNCPKCNNTMIRGRLLGDRYAIKWMNESDNLFLGIWARNSISLGASAWFGRPTVNGLRCEKCQVIVIDETKA